MSGTIIGAAPWTREAVRQLAHRQPDAFASLEASIPDSCYVVLTSGSRYGSWGAVLMAGDDQAPPREVARSTGRVSLIEAVAAAIYAGTVTA